LHCQPKTLLIGEITERTGFFAEVFGDVLYAEVMMNIRLWLLVIAGSLLLGAPSLIAQTYVSGEVFGVWSGVGNPYIVEDDLVVPTDKTLRINEGVQVLFRGYDSLSVYGRLVVVGTLQNPVIFDVHSSNSTGQWQGIFFKNGAMDDGEISYAMIGNSFIGVSISYSNVGVNHSSITARARGLDLLYSNGFYTENTIRCTFLSATGIYMVKCNAKIMRNTIHITSTSILFSSLGINANYCHNATIENNVILVEGAGDLYGIRFENSNNLQVCFNVIESFSQYISTGIFGIDSDHPGLRNNTVATASTGLDKGILCNNAHAIVTNNIVMGNGDLSCYGISAENSNLAISFNDIWNETVNYHGCQAGDHDISLDPRFIGGYPCDYHLTEGSPCIDAGNPSYTDPDGTRSDMGAYYFPQLTVPEPSEVSLPTHHRLYANFPNPFNSETVISFAISQRTHVTIDIVNVLGRTVARVLDSDMDSGEYSIPWSAGSLPSGMYFCRMTAGSNVFHQKIILLR
jgi:hypothetical protein